MLDKKDLDAIETIFDKKFTEVENRLDQKIDAKFEAFEVKMDKKIDAKFEAFEVKMDKKIDAKFEAFEVKMDKKMDAKFEAFEVKMDKKMDAKFEAFEVKMDQKMDAKFEDFKKQFSLELADVLHDITNTINSNFNKMQKEIDKRFAIQDKKIDLLLEYSNENLRKHNEYDISFSRIDSKLLDHDLRLNSLETRSATAI